MYPKNAAAAARFVSCLHSLAPILHSTFMDGPTKMQINEYKVCILQCKPPIWSLSTGKRFLLAGGFWYNLVTSYVRLSRQVLYSDTLQPMSPAERRLENVVHVG